MRNESDIKSLKVFSKKFSKCMFRILTALCFCILFLAIGRLLLIKNEETVRTVLSKKAVTVIREILDFFFQTTSVYQSLQILFTILICALSIVLLLACVIATFICAVIFFLNIGANGRAVEQKYNFKHSDTALFNPERLFLLFGRIRV